LSITANKVAALCELNAHSIREELNPDRRWGVEDSTKGRRLRA